MCAGAVAFMERAAHVTAPPELVTRILFEITSGPSHEVVKPSWMRRIFGNAWAASFWSRFCSPAMRWEWR